MLDRFSIPLIVKYCHMYVKRKVKSILNTGASDAVSTQDIVRIKLTNHIVVTGLALSLLNTILNAYYKEWPDVIAGVIIISFLGIIFFMIMQGFHKKASICLFVISIAIFTILKVLYGSQLKLEPVYLVFLLSSLITFETERMKLFSLLFVTIMYIIGNFADPGLAIYAEKVSSFANLNYFVFCAVLIYWIVSTLLGIHQKQSSQLKRQAEGLKNVVNSTAHDLKTPVHNVINLSQLIGRKIDIAKAEKEVQECFDIMDKSSRDIAQRIEDLQDQLTKQEFDFLI